MSDRCHQDSSRNGPRLVDGFEACGQCPDISKDVILGQYRCTKIQDLTRNIVRWPVSGPVLMHCPRRRKPEEE